MACPPLLVFILLLLAACSSKPPAQAATGYAYVGPGSLNLRRDLGPRSAVVDTAKHGDRLAVLEIRRRFAKVRTEKGVEGWADSSLLLTQKQMDDLDKLAKAAAGLPSQGKATVYDVLNVHTGANRPSPSFTQIPEGGTVEVLAHRVTMNGSVKSIPKSAPKRTDPTRKPKNASKKDSDLPPPPAPPPPTLPEDWTKRSVPRLTDLKTYQAPSPASAAKPTGEDWFLVRVPDGRVGWVLSRMLTMSIPDEVAQYGEGQHIAAYTSLGEVPDKNAKEPHHNWLWTTVAGGLHPYDFDSFRVFVWSVKRHHYETAFIERNVRGYYPILAVKLPDREEQGFTVVVEDKDGQTYTRTYAFSGYHVRMIKKEPYRRPPDLPMVSEVRTFDAEPGPEAPSEGWADGVRNWWKRTVGR